LRSFRIRTPARPLDREVAPVGRRNSAGEVTARGERELGISVSSAVMSFEHAGLASRQCSHGSRRGRGIEEQSRKLFEVCRLRDLPITTFGNELGRRNRFDLLDDIEESRVRDPACDGGQCLSRHRRPIFRPPPCADLGVGRVARGCSQRRCDDIIIGGMTGSTINHCTQ
jgi:hypothetical protein